MRLQKYITEKINSRKSGKWSGILYRAVDSKRPGDVALGSGLYLSSTIDGASGYGKDIRRFKTKKPMNVLGAHSNEYNGIWTFCNSNAGWDKYGGKGYSFAEMIRQEAEDRGYDAIYQDSIFGIVVFYPKKFLKELK